MLYRLFNGVVHEYSSGDKVPDLKYTGQVVMAIDPSKTNCAVVIGDPGGEIISIVEMSGNNWSAGPVEDTTQYCSEVREFLREYLKPADVYAIGLEKAITKKGMMHHHSNMVLTEIRGALLNLFWEEYKLKKEDVEVNNWTWKHEILPEGYRSQSEKGSVRYFSEYLHDNTYAYYFAADVTDCVCIYKYLTNKTKNNYQIACREVEEKHNDFKYAVMPAWADALGNREFEYNPSFTAEQNAIYFANRSHKNGIAKVDISRLSIDEIYSKSSGFTNIPKEGEARLVVIV